MRLRTLAALAAATALTATTLTVTGIIATAATASAGTYCESNARYCVGTSGTTWNNDVQEVGSPGRNLVFTNIVGCYWFNGTCYQKGILNFYGIGPNTCAVFDPSVSTVILNACSGVTGDVWYWYQLPGQDVRFGNQYQSNIQADPEMLSGRNVLNDNFLVKCSTSWCNSVNPYYQQMH